MSGILDGLKIIEMGHFVAIPAAGAMLADWGAAVIKVEPLTGELLRVPKRYHGVDKTIRLGESKVDWIIQAHNRNKKGLALDLKQDAGREILYRLVRQSDVFMTNYEINSLKKLKTDYATLSQFNPKLVYAIVTGYGTAGPDKDERGFDWSAAWARSGLQYLIGEPGTSPPPQRGGMMDRVTGTNIVAGVLAALWHRQQTGKGQEVECSLYHTGVWTALSDIQAALVGVPLGKHARTMAPNPLHNTYRTKDNRWFQLVMAQAEIWPGFCRAIEMPELEIDPRFSTIEAREQNCEELVGILDRVIASRDMAEWERRFRENKCIYGRVQTPTDVVNDVQAKENGFFAEVRLPQGDLKLVTTPVNFSDAPATLRCGAPEIGQDTGEIMRSLGYSALEITGFKEQKVIL